MNLIGIAPRGGLHVVTTVREHVEPALRYRAACGTWIEGSAILDRVRLGVSHRLLCHKCRGALRRQRPKGEK